MKKKWRKVFCGNGEELVDIRIIYEGKKWKQNQNLLPNLIYQ